MTGSRMTGSRRPWGRADPEGVKTLAAGLPGAPEGNFRTGTETHSVDVATLRPQFRVEKGYRIVHVIPHGPAAARRRPAVILTTLVTTAALAVGLPLAATPARAQTPTLPPVPALTPTQSPTSTATQSPDQTQSPTESPTQSESPGQPQDRVQNLCGQPYAPWTLREQHAGPGARVEIWQNQNTYQVRLANLQANGKTNVAGEAGTVRQGNDLGRTASIGDAPTGGWCSDTSTGSIWGALSWDVNGVHYWRSIACSAAGCVKAQVP